MITCTFLPIDPVAQQGGGMPMTSSHLMNPGVGVMGPSGMGPGSQMQPHQQMMGGPSQPGGSMTSYNNMAPNTMRNNCKKC